jgi:flagellar motor switch protein FliM
LGTSRVTLGDILNMQAGDVIPFSMPETVTAKVDDVPVMECSYGILNGQYALRVEQLLTQSINESIQGEQHG